MNETIQHDNKEITSLAKDLLNRALREIMAVAHAECGSLFLFDPEQKELVMNSFYNSSDLHIKGLRRKIGEGIAGKVADTKGPVLVKDITQDVRFHRNGYAHYRTNSFISIPIVDSGKLLGLINIADKADGKPFSQDDLTVVVTLTHYVSLVLQSLKGYAELKKEKESVDKQKALLEKYASVGKLAAGIVHEVNNPLDGIIRYTNMLLSHAEDASIDKEYLLEIKNGLDRIASITGSLLEFSHRINSHPPQKKQYIDVNEAIEQTLAALGEKFFKNIAVTKRYKKNLPAILDLGISHILINVIKNALDAMAEGGELEIATDTGDSCLYINVKDTGCGIKDEILEHIFEPFYTTKSAGKGSGLGLAICNEIVNRYEGKIEAQTSSGKGTSFRISIPGKYLNNA